MQKAAELILPYLPEFISDAVAVAVGNARVEEIRLRAGRVVTLVADGLSRTLDIVCTQEDLRATLLRLCENSLHAHEEELKQGYVTAPGGYRVGVIGRAVLENGRIIAVTDITSLNIRIPNRIYDVSRPVIDYLASTGFRAGALIYSAPGIGKTTLLRDMAVKLSSIPYSRRVAVIDSRGEIEGVPGIEAGEQLDILVGYPKALGIEIAVRTMNPEIILCDEIGTEDEARAILAVQSCGVPLIATAHGGSIGEVLSRRAIAPLKDAGAFDCYIGIKRSKNYGFAFSFKNKADIDKPSSVGKPETPFVPC